MEEEIYVIPEKFRETQKYHDNKIIKKIAIIFEFIKNPRIFASNNQQSTINMTNSFVNTLFWWRHLLLPKS